jgi:hypothetical protein
MTLEIFHDVIQIFLCLSVIVSSYLWMNLYLKLVVRVRALEFELILLKEPCYRGHL